MPTFARLPISCFLCAALALAAMHGCAARDLQPPPPSITSEIPGLTPALAVPELQAWVHPPAGWRRDKFDVDAKHTHAVWLSPTGDTAYGVVLMNLPLPVGPETVLWGFLSRLRATDNQADLLSKERAPDLPGLRFVAESGQYIIRVNLTVRDWHAWAVYAGSMKSRSVNQAELDLAALARDHTQVAMPIESAAAQ
jgi:hypothetical protein